MKNHDFPPGRVGGWKELGVSHHRTSMISMHPAALFGCASQSHAFWSQWRFFLICSCGTTTKYCRKKASGTLQGKLVLSSSGIFVHIQRFSATQDQLPRLAQPEFCITRISPRYPRNIWDLPAKSPLKNASLLFAWKMSNLQFLAFPPQNPAFKKMTLPTFFDPRNLLLVAEVQNDDVTRNLQHYRQPSDPIPLMGFRGDQRDGPCLKQLDGATDSRGWSQTSKNDIFTSFFQSFPCQNWSDSLQPLKGQINPKCPRCRFASDNPGVFFRLDLFQVLLLSLDFGETLD